MIPVFDKPTRKGNITVVGGVALVCCSGKKGGLAYQKCTLLKFEFVKVKVIKVC